MKLQLYILSLTAIFLFSCSPSSKLTSKSKVGNDEEIELEYILIKANGNFITGNYVKALEYYNKGLEIAPNNATFHYKIGETLFMMEDDRALAYAKKAVELNRKNPAFYVLLANIFEKKLMLKEEARTFEQLLENNPKQVEYYYDLADIYSSLGQNALRKKVEMSLNSFSSDRDNGKELKKIQEEIDQNFDKALECFDKIEKHFGPSEELIRNKQWIYLRQGNVDKAIAEGDILIESNPDDIAYQIHQVEILYSNKREAEALERLKVIQKNNPENAEVMLLLYDFQDLKEDQSGKKALLRDIFNNPNIPLDEKVKRLQPYFADFEEEQAYVKELIGSLSVIHPEEAMAYTLKGDFYNSVDSLKQSRNAYFQSLLIDEDNFELWQQVISQDLSLGQTDSLLNHCKKALELYPNQPVLWLYKGVGHSMKKQYAESVAALEHGKLMTGSNLDLESSFNAQLGDSYNGLKEYQKSDEAYDAALAHNPNDGHVLNNYSYFLSLRKDKLEKAEAMCEKLMIMYPNDPTYLDTYGWVLYQMKKYEKAEIFLKKAAKDSDSGTILEHYGDVLYQLNRKDEALKYWKKAKKAGDTSDLIDKKIANNFLYE